MSGKKVIYPTECISVEVYRDIQHIQETYKFKSIEETINVIVDFIGDHRVELNDYIVKQFPDKFL
jgi:hypothetical protein